MRRLPVKLMISGAVYMVVSVVCLLGVWGRVAALGELSEYLGMTDDFQHRLVELSWCRDRQEMDRQLTELQHVFETMNGKPNLLKEIGGRYGGQGKVIQGELAVLKAAGLGVNRLQDSDKIREISDQMGELAGLAVARMLVNRSLAWRYAVVWLVVGILLLAVAGACGMHPLFDTALFDKLLLQCAQVSVEHGVYLMAEGKACVGHRFVVPFLEVRLVVFQAIVTFAEVAHGGIAWMLGRPDD